MAGRDRSKAAIKRGVKSLAAWGGRWMRCRGSRILTYHSVGYRKHAMNVTPEAFEAQMAYVASHCRVGPLEAAVSGEEVVAVTFDDGYRDNLLNAAPVLKRLGVPATFFVVAGRLGGVLDGADEPDKDVLMTREEVVALRDMGFSIGSHTLNHARLSTLPEEEQRTEIEGCRVLLGEYLGEPVRTFAYPFGSLADYDDVSRRIVSESGYEVGVSNRYGVNGPGGDRWALRRIWVDATDTMASFEAKVEGRLDVLWVLDSRAGIAGRRLLNRVLGIR